jgi:hypothetical protein
MGLLSFGGMSDFPRKINRNRNLSILVKIKSYNENIPKETNMLIMYFKRNRISTKHKKNNFHNI